MRRAVFLASARDDLLRVLEYIAEESGSISIAENYVRQLRVRCHKLAGLASTLGRARPELRRDIRSIPHGNYVIFFRYAGGRFEVVNII